VTNQFTGFGNRHKTKISLFGVIWSNYVENLNKICIINL
jgi:hypothetical protein